MRPKNARRSNAAIVFIVDRLESRVLLSASFDITGLTALRNDAAFSQITGQGVGIAVLDTGVDAANPELTPQVEAFYNAVEDPITTTDLSPSNAVDNDGHGTHVSGIAASSDPAIGVAYGAKLVDIKVVADQYESQLAGDPLLRGLEWVAANYQTYNIRVVNISLGESSVNDNTVTSADAQDAEAVEIKQLEALGITVVSAAGNSYAQYESPGESFPAIVSTVAVGNTWADTGQASDFGVAYGGQGDLYGAVDTSATPDTVASTSQRSNVGNMILAPGEDIYSDWNGVADPTGSNGNDLLHNTLSGTSMSSPFISGVVALMQQAAEYFGGHYLSSTSQILQIIQQTGDTVIDSNNPTNYRENVKTGQTSNLPETGLTFQRVDVLKAIEEVERLVTGGSITTGPAPGPDQTNTTATAVPVNNLDGTTVYTFDGNIGTDGLVEVGNNDVDLYQLNVVSPGQVTFTLSLPSGGTAFSPALRLFDGNGNVLASAAGSPSAYPTLTSNGALAVGTYYLGITSVGNQSYTINGTGAANGMSQGDYALQIQLVNPDPNGTIQGAVTVDLTDPNESLQDPNTGAYYTDLVEQGDLGSDPPPTGSTARITVSSDVDMFQMTAPDNGTLDLTAVSGAYSGNETFMEVFDSTGKSLATSTSDPNSYDGENDLSLAVTAGDTYYVGVTVPDNSKFNPTNPYIGRATNATPTDEAYDLHLRFDNKDADGTALNANNVNIGETINAAISTDNGVTVGANGSKDVDWYAYTAQSDGLFNITAQSTASGFTPVISLWNYTSGGTSITKIADTSSSSLFASPSSLFATAAVTPPGAAGSAQITYQVSAGESFFVAISGQGDDNFNWYAVASGAGGQTGNYTITTQLQSLTTLNAINDNSIDNGTPESISVGQTVNGNIGADGSLVIGPTDVDMYKFVALATENLEIQTYTGQEGDAATGLRVFDANGNQLAANENSSSSSTSSQVTLSVQAGMTYYIGVDGAGANWESYDPLTGNNAGTGSTGNYSLSVTSLTPGFAVANPGAVSALVGGNIVFTVTLSQALTAAATVDYSTADGTAIAGTDYTAESGVLTFPAGTTSETISVPVTVNTTAPTGSKTFTLSLSTPSSNTTIVTTAATATIDEGALSPVQITITAPAPASATGGSLVFTVMLSQAATTDVTVDYATSDGTAIAGTDYSAEAGTLTFPAGTTSQTISVPVLANTVAGAGSKTFTLTLSGVSSNANIMTSTATGTIDSVAVVPQLTINTPAAISDAGGNLLFTVTLSQAAASVVTVDYATSDGDALAGIDYTAESGTLTFPAGATSETISVPVLINTNADFGSVSFTVSLTNPTGATLNSADAVGTIDDVPVSTLNFAAQKPAKYIDSVGKTVELMLAGPGVGTAVFISGSADPTQITLDNTTAASTFTVRTAAAALGDIAVNGSLFSIDAKSAALDGSLTVSGSLGKLLLGAVHGADGDVISIGTAAAPTSIILGAVTDESLSTPGAISTLKVNSWTNTLGASQQISAVNIGSLTSLGNFAANVSASSLGTVKIAGSLSGDTITAATIDRLTVAGGMSNATLNLTGSGQTLSNLTVAQEVDNSQILSTGNIGKVTVGGFVDSNLFAGVDPSITALPTDTSDFTGSDSIGSVIVTGKTTSYSFSDSNIAAATIGDVIIARVNSDNNGASFGVAAEHLASFANRGVLKWTSKKPITLLAPDGDFVVKLLS